MKRHKNRNNRRLHFIGWLLAVLVILQSVFTFDLGGILYAIPLVLGFTFAGHHFCEEEPMSFADPVESLKCHLGLCRAIVSQELEF